MIDLRIHLMKNVTATIIPETTIDLWVTLQKDLNEWGETCLWIVWKAEHCYNVNSFKIDPQSKCNLNQIPAEYVCMYKLLSWL